MAAIKDSVIDWVTGDGRNVVAAALSGYLTYYVASGTLLAVFGPYLAIPASFMLTSINAHLLNGILGAPARLAAAQGQYVNGILGGNDPNDAL